MRKPKKFNAIIFKAHDSESFVFVRYNKGKIEDSFYKIDLADSFMTEENVKGKFPSHKIVLSDINMTSETELTISPKYCVEVKFENKPVNFWHVVEKPDYLAYFMSKILKKI